MRKYRYRTSVLAGPWRPSADQALGDAIKARQVVVEGEPSAIRWIVPGQIEEKEERRLSR